MITLALLVVIVVVACVLACYALWFLMVKTVIDIHRLENPLDDEDTQ